ncbi:hypothetical protein H072_11091 [Dactylellina haptotyla CBS 200.50]|uniref:DUF7908 domain-containing protein n=1 Tax=Dactylellina haptotyla (strain CBS 200.50) TaxID=1284197 RepID=S8A2W6_DACHA|nr:hypothetical protein H072_11091 [Dactylellina haptotyla CBS 200.50]
MARPLFFALFVFSILSFTSAAAVPTPASQYNGHIDGQAEACSARRALGYVTPSPGAKPVPITVQGQPVTTYIPTGTALAREEEDTTTVTITKYLTSTYLWYSTYIPAYPHGNPQFISRGDQVMTLAPKELPKYAVRTMTYTTPGVYELEGQTHKIEVVPTEIQYAKQISRGFGVCRVHDYLEWIKMNDQRATSLKSNKASGGRVNHLLGYGQTHPDRRNSSFRRLDVEYVTCKDDVCTTEVQKWSVGYRSQVRKRVIKPEFTGWCDGNGLCELCADIPGHGKIFTQLEVSTRGPCTTSAKITTEETVTRTITRTRTISTVIHTTIASITTGTSSLQVPDAAALRTTATISSASVIQSDSSIIPSTSPSQDISATAAPSGINTSVSSAPSSSSAPLAPSNPSPFRIRIRDTTPTKRLSRRQSTPWYIRISDNTMYVATNITEAAIFSISNQQLKLSTNEVAFANPADIKDWGWGPILVGTNPSGPSTVFSVDPDTGSMTWNNPQFKRGNAAFCMDDDEAINGVYAGPIDALCEEVELSAEYIDSSAIPSAVQTTTSSSAPTGITSSAVTTQSETSGPSSTDISSNISSSSSKFSALSSLSSMTDSVTLGPAAEFSPPASSSSSSSVIPTFAVTGPPPISSSLPPISSISFVGTSSPPGITSDSSLRELPTSSSIPTTMSTVPLSSIVQSTIAPSSEPQSPSSTSATPSSTTSQLQCTPVATGVNHIQNPGFESSSLSPWNPLPIAGDGIKYSISTAHPDKGISSLFIELTSTPISLTLSQTITTCPGREYKGAAFLNLAIEGETDSCSLVILINGVAVAVQDSTAGNYSEVPFEFTAATNHATLGLYATCQEGATKGTFYIDSVELLDKTPRGNNNNNNNNNNNTMDNSGGDDDEGEKKEDEKGIMTEVWHFLQMLGDILERFFVLIIGDL